jgi:serine/threonine-protein kinase
MPIPKFSTLRPDIDPPLEAIIQKAFQRDRDKRYQTAAEMLTDLEVYLYSDRYGPTNEKLGVYLRELMDHHEPGTHHPLSRSPAPAT